MVGVGRDLIDHLLPTSMPWAGTPSTTQSPIQPGPEHFQGWGIHSFSGQPVPAPHHPHHKEFLSFIQSKSTLCQFKAITPCPITTGPCKKPPSSFLAGPLEVLEGCCKVSPEPSPLQAEQPQLSGFWDGAPAGKSLAPPGLLCRRACSAAGLALPPAPGLRGMLERGVQTGYPQNKGLAPR